MSRGRPRHQANRRRSYSIRQREVRERRQLDAQREPRWLTAEEAGVEAEERLDFESPTSWAIRLPGRATAA